MGDKVTTHSEKVEKVGSGWGMLAVLLVAWPGSVAMFIGGMVLANTRRQVPGNELFAAVLIIAAIVLFIGCILMLPGFFTLQPNEARVLVLFGDYKGTVRESGFYWGNPFYATDARAAEEAKKREAREKEKTDPAKPKVKVNLQKFAKMSLQEIEGKISKLEETLALLEGSFSNPKVAANPQAMKELQQKYEQGKKDLAEHMAAWESKGSEKV